MQRARALIEERDREVAECKTQAHDMYEKYAEERERNERQAVKLAGLEREAKALAVRGQAEAEAAAREAREEAEATVKKMSQRVREVEKAAEVQRVTMAERMNMAIDLKEAEAAKAAALAEGERRRVAEEVRGLEEAIKALKEEVADRDRLLEAAGRQQAA